MSPDPPARSDLLGGPVGPALAHAFLQRQREVAASLVLLEPWSLQELRRELEGMAAFLSQGHIAPGKEAAAVPSAPSPGEPGVEERAIQEDHLRFQESLGQLRWYWDLVCEDPHPGTFQALGQYWRALVEATFRHVEAEADLRSMSQAPGTERGPVP